MPKENNMDCPYIKATDFYEVIPSGSIETSISLFHACESSCKIVPTRRAEVERESVSITSSESFLHDYSNNKYFVNIYALSLYH